MDQRYGKKEKLKNKILINRLFAEGKSLNRYPLKLVYLPIDNPRVPNHLVAVSVPKRSFKKAVERARLKRLMREAFRKNKYLVAEKGGPHALMFLYIAREQQDYAKVFAAAEQLLEALSQRLNQSQ